MPKQNIKLMLLVFAFIVGCLWIATRDDGENNEPSTPRLRAAQTSTGYTLSPSAQEGERRVLAVLRSYVQELWLNSIRALGPNAEAYLSFQNTTSPYDLTEEVPMVVSLLQMLPPQLQQTFMNGVVGVSQPEQQFAARVMSLRIKGNVDLSALNAVAQEQLRIQGLMYECNLGPDSCMVLRRVP